MTWSIVHFVVDDTVEVVPSQWIKRNGYCAWPKNLKMNDVKKLVKNKVRPNKFDFNLFKARCLAGALVRIILLLYCIYITLIFKQIQDSFLN